MFATMLDALKYHAQDRPDCVAVYDADRGVNHTWADMLGRAHRSAAFLTERLGLTRGDVVACVSDNDVLLIDLFFASCETGIVIDALNPRLKAVELGAMLRREAPRALFAGERFEEKAADALASTGQAADVAVFSKADVEDYDPVGFFRPVAPGSEDAQLLIHTGGTTGVPKAAALSYRCLLMNAVAETASWRLTQRDACYAGMPLYHTVGWNVSMVPLLYVGGTVSVTARFDVETFFDLVEAGKVTVFTAADAILRRVAEHPRFDAADLSALRLVCCGASRVSQRALDLYWARGIRLVMGYGLSEYGPNAICPSLDFTLDESCKKPFIIGKPLMFTEARIVRDDGLDAQVGEAGELYLRGCAGIFWLLERRAGNARGVRRRMGEDRRHRVSRRRGLHHAVRAAQEHVRLGRRERLSARGRVLLGGMPRRRGGLRGRRPRP